MIKTLALAAALSLASASAAFADATVVAALQTPMTKPAKIVAGGAVWTCADNACTAANGETRILSVSACHDLGLEVGPMASYGAQGRAFADRELARCNAGLKPAAGQTATASR